MTDAAALPSEAALPDAAGRLSIVAPVIDEHALLDAFLASIAARLPGTEIVVVNMGGWTPQPGHTDVLDVKPVISEVLSIAAAKNLGLRNASRDYVALMDSDNVLLGPAELWRQRLAEAMADHPDLITLGRREEGRAAVTPVAPSRWNFSRHTIGWSVIWRRAHIQAIGGMDERFGTGTFAGCGEDFPPLYEHFAASGATTYPLPDLGVGHPSLQKPVDAWRLYRYTYGSAISTLIFIRRDLTPMALFWALKTVAGSSADLLRGVRRRDPSWTRTVLRARGRAVVDALILGRPRRLPESRNN